MSLSHFDLWQVIDAVAIKAGAAGFVVVVQDELGAANCESQTNVVS